jgi:chaperonin GroEL
MDNITLNPQEGFLKGISKVSAIIRASYGKNGCNVSVEDYLMPLHKIVNDADSIIQSIYLDDPIEKRGLNFIKELSAKATKDSQDGRKTTIIIAEALLRGGFEQNIKGMKLKEELDSLLPQVLESIDKQSKRVKLEDIGMVAETSSRSSETGKWIAKIYQEIGRDGIIQIEPSGMEKTIYEVTDGVRFHAGALTTSFYNSKDGAVYENPLILVTKQKIEKYNQIAPLVEYIIKVERPLVIFTDDMDENIAVDLIKTHLAKKAKILIIKAPVVFKHYIFEDFAKCVGATVVESSTGLQLGEKLPLTALGTCDYLVSDREDTVLRGIKDITAHKESLRKVGDDDSLRRLEWLNTKTAVLKMGANSESELSYKLLKAKDAVSACKWALDSGVVIGAGESLRWAKGEIMMVKNQASDIFQVALEAPYKQLCENSNMDRLEYGDSVLDSALVIKNAVKNAVSLSGIILTTGADIRLREKTKEEQELEILTLKNRPF